MKQLLFIVSLMLLVASPASAGTPSKDHGAYKVRKKDAALKELMDQNKAALDAVRKARKDHEKKLKEEKKQNPEKRYRMDFTGVTLPASPQAFSSAFHFEPVAQYLTGTCWSFSTTSFMESEVARISGRKIKLSEIHTVYYEYIEKVRRFVQEYGHSLVAEGSEADAIPRIWKQYGAVPESVYTGTLPEQPRHNHALLIKELTGYLKYVKENDLWDEDMVLAHTRLILNKYLGEPPVSFQWEGHDYTPQSFLKDVLKLNMDDYLVFSSFEYMPFWTIGEFKVPDNWGHSRTCHNVPLPVWYNIFKRAIQNGYTAALGGDVSEPGYEGEMDAAVVPDFDIPEKYINQDAREFRFANHTTTDDHGIHAVGWLHMDGHDWYLIKDSSRSGHKGKFKGYLFYREDYVKLKMLTFMVHKDAVDPKILEKFKPEPAQPMKTD